MPTTRTWVALLGLQVMVVLSVPLNQYDIQQAVLEQPTERGKAGLPVANPTKSFWIDTPGANPLATEGSEGALTGDADVCIIGSGITGVSAAYHLSEAIGGTEVSVKAVILEARDFCSGATGRNGGHLTPASFFDFKRYEKMYGTEQAIRSYALENHTASEILKILQRNELGDLVDLVAGGHFDLLFTEEETIDAKADFEAAQKAGLNLSSVAWLTKETMESTYGTSYSAVRIPGHNLWPLKLVTQLYILAKSKAPSQFSLNIHTRTPVTAIDAISSSNHTRRWNLSTPRGPISCSYVIHATNAYASHLIPHMRGHSGIIPTRGQIIALRAAVPISRLTKSSWSGNEGFEYWFPRPVSRSDEPPLVILGGGREAAKPGFEIYEEDDSNVNPNVAEALKDFLPGVYPGKFEQGRTPEMEWTGIMGYTKLGDPFVGPILDKSRVNSINYQGQYVAAGYTGHGMPRAFACAEIVAGMVAAELSGWTWRAPEWLPERYLTWARDAETGL